MKLKLVGITYSQLDPDNKQHLLHVLLLGESGETYRFGGWFNNAEIVKALRVIADEIATIRRKRKRPTYTVKSLMPQESQAARRALDKAEVACRADYIPTGKTPEDGKLTFKRYTNAAGKVC